MAVHVPRLEQWSVAARLASAVAVIASVTAEFLLPRVPVEQVRLAGPAVDSAVAALVPAASAVPRVWEAAVGLVAAAEALVEAAAAAGGKPS